MRLTRILLTVAALGLTGANVFGQTTYDGDVTPDVIFGSGNANGGFTIQRSAGVELALRGKLRFNASGLPENTFNSNSDGSYSFSTRTDLGDKSEWSFEFCINSDTSGTDAVPVGNFTYELGVDDDPTLGTNFLAFDPINLEAATHDFGTSSTTNGGGSFASSPEEYATFLATKTVVQQSWRPHFFMPYLNIDPAEVGVYDIYLKAFDNGTEIASVAIQIYVGADDFSGPAQEVVDDATTDLIDYTASLNLKKGINNALDSKLENAVDAYVGGALGSSTTVVNKLNGYINSVNAQRGKKLTNEEADNLVEEAEYIQVLVTILD